MAKQVAGLIKLQIKPKQLNIMNNNQIFEYMSKFKMLTFNEKGILTQVTEARAGIVNAKTPEDMEDTVSLFPTNIKNE